MKNNNKPNTREAAKKALAITAALGVIAGLGSTLLSEDAQARNIANNTSSQSESTSVEETTTVRRPSSNALSKTKSSDNEKTSRTRGYSTKNDSSARRKAGARVVNGVTSDDTSSYSAAKDKTSSYRSVSDKKEASKEKAQKDKVSSYSTDSNNSDRKIVVRVATK